MENRRIVESTGRSQASKASQHDDKLNYYYAGRRIREKRIRMLERKLADVAKLLLRRVNHVAEDHQEEMNRIYSTLQTTCKMSEVVSGQLMMMTDRVCALECRLVKIEGGPVGDVDAHDILGSVSDSSDSTVQSSIVHPSSQSMFKGLAVFTTVLFLLVYMVLQCVLGALTKLQTDVVQSFIAWREWCFGAGDRRIGFWWRDIRRRGKKKKTQKKRNFKTLR